MKKDILEFLKNKYSNETDGVIREIVSILSESQEEYTRFMNYICFGM